MKTINVSFEEEDFKKVVKVKEELKKTWPQYIILLTEERKKQV